mmetsp:Transcript_1469/g.2961  ORF Transcript_1469/g.2961 Transcript_1469/m.2961 type:complete len:219 (+) Transcript_1469:2032-2688(+)
MLGRAQIFLRRGLAQDPILVDLQPDDLYCRAITKRGAQGHSTEIPVSMDVLVIHCGSEASDIVVHALPPSASIPYVDDDHHLADLSHLRPIQVHSEGLFVLSLAPFSVLYRSHEAAGVVPVHNVLPAPAQPLRVQPKADDVQLHRVPVRVWYRVPAYPDPEVLWGLGDGQQVNGLPTGQRLGWVLFTNEVVHALVQPMVQSVGHCRLLVQVTPALRLF